MGNTETRIGLTVLAAIFACGCNNSGNDSGSRTMAAVAESQAGVTAVGKITLSVLGPNQNMIFSGTGSSSAFAMVMGQPYDFRVQGTNVAPGTTFTLSATDIDSVNAQPVTSTLQLGDNSYNPPSAGDYVFAITPLTVPAGTVAPIAAYQAAVTCANPTFTAASLNPAGITVTPGAGTNIYDFSGATAIAGANGMAPYLCAWDVDGVGIKDSPFASCSIPLTGEYVNYVGLRNIGLMVKDACNTTVTISNPVTLAATTPSMPGNVFIQAQLSGATQSAATDPSINGVSYLATNSDGFNIVMPSYSQGAAGQSTFTIYSAMNYGLSSSVNFGMELDLGGITDNLSVSGQTGSVDVSQATLNKLAYSTDQAGDQAAARTLTSTSCTLTNPGARVLFLQGTPCSAGTTGDNNAINVEVWGTYSCPSVSDSGGSVAVQGTFDGVAHLADSCVGGGGGGGGGIVPIGL